MKITDPDVIKSGENDLIEAVKEDIDWNAVGEVIKDRMEITSFSAEGGGILVHNNRIAFKIDFNLSFKGSLMFDREGNYIPSGEETAETTYHAESSGNLEAESETEIESKLESELETEAETEAESGDDPASASAAQDTDSAGEASADESDMLNEDIDDILKESREFWEKGGE